MVKSTKEMEEVLFIESGRKRKGEWHNCEFCDKKFVRRKAPYKKNGKSYKKKFCSKKCSYSAREDKIDLKCHLCKNKFQTTPSRLKKSKHGFHFCSNKCHNEARKIDSGVNMIRPDHYGNGQTSYRNKVDLTEGCSVCEEKEFFRITVHHIDGDRTNNKLENLEVVCWNCHAVRHLIYSNGEWRWNSMSLTPRNIVEEFDKKTKERLCIQNKKD